MQENSNILLNQQRESDITYRPDSNVRKFGINANNENHAFFSVISHNIKNPFSTLLGFTDLLFEDFDELDNEERKFYLNEIKKSANFTYQYIEKFFEWIYYKTGKIKLEFQPIRVKETIEKIIKRFESDNNYKFSIETIVDKNLTVYADLDSLEKILYNLIDNAIKFTTSSPKIIISAKTLNDKIEISIQDNGIGISSEDIKKLFNIAIDPINIGKHNKKGIGLGLILTKELITLNNGTISIDSNKDKGSIFSLVLPNIEYLDF
jgi:K+-sensing histidine kinase KdpD